jgi:hypothetical protein
MRRADQLAELEEDRRRFLHALYDIRNLIAGKQVTVPTVQKILQTIDEAVMCGKGKA